MLEYHRRLYKAGYVALHWPKEWGGGGASMSSRPSTRTKPCGWALPLYGANQLAIDRIGPTIMLMGTERRKKRYLPKMLTGEEIWCQGYSDPTRASDLAGLQTRAVLDGDTFVVNGQRFGRAWRIVRTGRYCWCAPIRRPQAQGDFVPAGRYAQPRNYDPSAGADYRRVRVQRGFL